MGNLIIASQFFLSLSLLIILHEYGHFQTARWFGMRVEKFYLFFNPWFSLYKKDIGETEYGIGWLPLGGYVKIAGMMDESMDREQLALPPQPWEFRSKPAWQRLIVMLGGVIVNFLLGFFIYSMVIWTYGKEYLPAGNVPQGIELVDSSMCQKLGLQAGDRILKVGQEDFVHFDQNHLLRGIVIEKASEITINRQGETKVLAVDAALRDELMNYKKLLFTYRMPFVIDKLGKGAAEAAGLQAGDSIVGIDGEEALYFFQAKNLLETRKGKEINLAFYRGGEAKEVKLKLNDEGQLGVYPRTPVLAKEEFSLAQSFPEGYRAGMKFLIGNLMGLKAMVTGELSATKGLGGFISIAKVFPSEWDWEIFWTRTAVLSLILGMMNLLPIPALDGGHALFTLFEIIFRRPLPPKLLEYLQLVGIILLFSLLLFANGLDIYRNFFGG